MANNVDIIYGFIDGVYQSASGKMTRLRSRKIVIKYLTMPDYLEMLTELTRNTNKWAKSPYILHVMLWGLRNDSRKYNEAILQRMSPEQIAVLQDAISVAKGYKCPDRKMAKQASNNYTKKKKTQKLSIEDNVAWYSARIAIDVADNWDKMVAELDTWEQIIKEFKPSKTKAKKIRNSIKNPRSEYRHKYYDEHRTEILEQKHLRNVCDDAKREEINAKRRERYRQNPEPYKERSRQRRLAQPADARKEYHSAYYQEKKAEKAQKAHERQEKLNQQIDSAMQMCAAYVLLMNLKKSKDKDEKKQYLELYTRKQEPLTDMLKRCVALRKMDMNLCPFCNPDSEQMVEECCNKKVLAIPDAINQLQLIANDLSRQK